jgi:hypothetical protein
MSTHDPQIILRTKLSIHLHRDRVAKYLTPIIQDLQQRAVNHDDSKFGDDELIEYASAHEEFDTTPFGTPEYLAIKERIKPAIDRHFKRNRHHPEYHRDGIKGMDLIDLVEMLCDWRSATKNHDVGSTMEKSIDFAVRKYSIGPELEAILRNTARNYNLLKED